jgi:site-specific DNA-methyltransferase (adenine-specific)
MVIKLYQGDCLELMKDLPDGSIDLVLTDPPYLINYKTNRRKDKTHRFCKPIINDNNDQLIIDFIYESYRVLKDNTAFYCFCSPDTVEFFKYSIQQAGFKIKNIIVWVKNNWTAGDLKAQYGKQYELIIYANKGRRELNGKRISDVWYFDRVAGKKQLHQNQKPLELIQQIIEKSSKENDLVLDPFMGSGSTGVACINTNRNFIGIEKDETYFKIAKKRIDEAEKSKYVSI